MGQSRLILFCPRRFQVDYYSPLLQETVGMVVYRGVSLRDSKTASEWKGWMVEPKEDDVSDKREVRGTAGRGKLLRCRWVMWVVDGRSEFHTPSE
jgi:hypothetical protein